MIGMVAKTVLLFLVIGIIDIVKPFGPKSGPYDTEINKIELCENRGSGKIVIGSRITSVGKGKYVYKDNFTLGVPADENLMFQVEFQKWGNGGWRPKAFEHKFKNCEDIWKLFGDFLHSFMKTTGVTVDKCPIPEGSYKADWVIEVDSERLVPVMEYGKYRAIGRWHYKNEFVGCINVYLEIVPKAFGK